MSFIGNIKNEILSARQKGNVQQYAADTFLTAASGSIKKGYQIDFIFHDIESARTFSDLLAAFDILPKMLTRKTSNNANQFVVYIKSKECVCNLLALVGANKSLMELNNEIAMRELRGNANRRTNCDTHNIERSVSAAREQTEAVKYLAAAGRTSNIDARLQETVNARLAHPEASLDELALMLGISKSGLVNRFKRLLKTE